MKRIQKPLSCDIILSNKWIQNNKIYSEKTTKLFNSYLTTTSGTIENGLIFTTNDINTININKNLQRNRKFISYNNNNNNNSNNNNTKRFLSTQEAIIRDQHANAKRLKAAAVSRATANAQSRVTPISNINNNNNKVNINNNSNSNTNPGNSNTDSESSAVLNSQAEEELKPTSSDKINESAIKEVKHDSSVDITTKENDINNTVIPSRWDKIKDKVKKEAQHYWGGTKQLGYEIKLAAYLYFRKQLSGQELNRSEKRQLHRTKMDLYRLVPFTGIVLIPFAELLLPVVLKLFPNFLPSTFEAKATRDKKIERLRETRQSEANFLWNSMKEGSFAAASVKSLSENDRNQLGKFFLQVEKLRKTGESPSYDDLIFACKILKDEIVLDNLSRPQLVAMCRFMNLTSIGPSTFLRILIRKSLARTKTDDFDIDYEGVSSLSVAELQAVCISRGIQSYSVSSNDLRHYLQVWLNLRLKDRVPATLLILASASLYAKPKVNLSAAAAYYEALLGTLSGIPKELEHSEEKKKIAQAALLSEKEDTIVNEKDNTKPKTE